MQIPKQIKDLGLRDNPNGGKRYRYGIFECMKCSSEFEAIINNAKKGKTKYCQSCRKGGGVPKPPKEPKQKLPRTTYKKSDTRADRAYNDMIKKCYKENHPEYYLYGGAGVTVSEEFLNSREKFTRRYNDLLLIDKKISIEIYDREFNSKSIMMIHKSLYKDHMWRRKQVLAFPDGTGAIFDYKKECYLGYYKRMLISDYKTLDDFLETVEKLKQREISQTLSL